MSMFDDGLNKTGNFAIGYNNSNMQVVVDPETFVLSTQNISEFGRLADSADGEGKLIGVKYTIEMTYSRINLKHFQEIYNNTQKKYNNNGEFFMNIKVPLYAENKTITIRGYFQSSLKMQVCQTSEYENDSSYKLGGNNFNCMYEDMTISFVQK